jgi:Bacterial pre-peptidase C-terminal domain
VLLSLGGTLRAAPPSVTYFYPSGAERGTTVEVTAGGTFERWPVQVWASDKAITATATKDKGKLSVAVAADAVPGVYWLRLYDAQGASFLRPFVVGTLPELTEREPNDEPAKAQSVAGPAVVNGRLEKAGDVDVFSVPLKKGETLVASVDAYQSLRSPMDAVLQVLSADGFVLDQNNDWHGLDPQVAFTAPRDGTYLARLFAFPAVPDAGIRLSGGEAFVYRLTLTTGGFADYAMPLAVQRKPDARVIVHGWNIPAEAETVPVTAGGDWGTVFHPRLANAWRVRVEDHPCRDVDSKRPAEPLQPPFSVTGRLDRPGAAGTVTVVAKKGQPLHLRAESREFGLPVNPVLRVLDPAGKQLARAEPPKINTDVGLTFNPPADGPYTVEVQDLHGAGGPRFVYRLRVAPPEPDFDLTVAPDRFALAPGKPLDIPVTVARRDGFAGEVEVTAEGLPAGVSAAVVPPPGKGDGKTVTLRLTADKAGPPGPFRIVGRAKAQPALTRAARAPLAEFDSTTAALWLAVGGQVQPAPPKKKR